MSNDDKARIADDTVQGPRSTQSEKSSQKQTTISATSFLLFIAGETLFVFFPPCAVDLQAATNVKSSRVNLQSSIKERERGIQQSTSTGSSKSAPIFRAYVCSVCSTLNEFTGHWAGASPPPECPLSNSVRDLDRVILVRMHESNQKRGTLYLSLSLSLLSLCSHTFRPLPRHPARASATRAPRRFLSMCVRVCALCA